MRTRHSRCAEALCEVVSRKREEELLVVKCTCFICFSAPHSSCTHSEQGGDSPSHDVLSEGEESTEDAE